MTFLKEDYKVPEASGGYMKLKKGENKFRIVSESITGYEYWNNSNKPVRSEEYPTNIEDPKVNKDGSIQKPKHFWAFIVWDYADDSLKILEITQATIQQAIYTLFKNEKWGEPQAYDLVITREGDGLDTKYNTLPDPKTELTKEQQEAVKNAKINLKALYDGADPFEKNTAPAGDVDDESLPF